MSFPPDAGRPSVWPGAAPASRSSSTGFFAAAWFSWGASDASSWLNVLLVVASVAGVTVGVLGLVLGRRARPDPGPNAMRSRTYAITVLAEAVVALAGAIVLGATGHHVYIAAWVALVVGVHFFPLARLFGRMSMTIVGALVCTVAVAAIVAGAVSSANPQVIAGTGVGAVLLGSALLLLPRARQRL